MKVRELIEKLSEMDQELDVWTAIDAEGNGYNAVYYEPTIMLIDKDDLERDRSESVYNTNELEWLLDEEYFESEDDLGEIVVI